MPLWDEEPTVRIPVFADRETHPDFEIPVYVDDVYDEEKVATERKLR